MAAENSLACKRKIDFSQFDSEDSDQNSFLNESEVSESSSDSEDIALRTASF